MKRLLLMAVSGLIPCALATGAAKWDAKAHIGCDAFCLPEARPWFRAAHLKLKRGRDITVEFQDLGPLLAGTYWILDGDRIVGAHIIVRPRLVTSEAVFQAVMLHEMGHALGLGHSENSEDVMYHWFYGRTKLSDGDKAAIRELYAHG